MAGASWYGSPMQDNADVSSFAVARYTPAGALDRRFSGDGKIVTFLGNGFLFEQATAVALQPDGAIVVAGEAGRHDGDFGVVRYVVPTSRPDAQIKQRSRPFFIGDDLYGPPVWRQTWNADVRHGTTFLIRAENDGSSPDGFVFDGCASSSSFAVRYFVGDTPVTRRVVDGTYEVNPVAPGGVVQLRLTIQERAGTDGGRFVCRVEVRSAIDDAKFDVVRAIVYTGPLGCLPDGIRERSERAPLRGVTGDRSRNRAGRRRVGTLTPAPVAQGIEQGTSNPQVAGSNPARRAGQRCVLRNAAGVRSSKSAMMMSPQSTMTPAIITAMPGAGRGSPSRIASSIARHRRRAMAAVTTPARISRIPTISHAHWNVCPARSRAAATPEATSASAVRSHARYVRSFASWNCTSGLRRSLMSAPLVEMPRA